MRKTSSSTAFHWKQSIQTYKTAAQNHYAKGKEWLRIHLRRVGHFLSSSADGTKAIGPVAFLLVSGALGTALTVTTLYSTSYAVSIDGEMVGVVADQEIITNAIRTVEHEGSELLGQDYQVDSQIDCQFTLSLKSDLSNQETLEQHLYSRLDQVSDSLRVYEVTVAGKRMGVVEDRNALEDMLNSIQAQYRTDYTVKTEFVETVEIEPVYYSHDLLSVEEMQEKLEANTTGETTYTVVKGDTFNGIAYANDMSLSELMALNPEFSVNRLMIGDVLNVKEKIPTLSVKTIDNVLYTESIECPVEIVEDDTMYEGNSKILTQGVEGEAKVAATITYVNGVEKEREITSSTTLREPTVTVKAVGTKERPKTASTGTYIWPVYGRISSYFGGRNIFGSYSYHSGLDIATSHGNTIKASDGGTVTFSGWKGTYGNLVIITHDNGTKTYYAHNSSLLVKAGDKVYQGQAIARAGSTGRSTGTHCHFEIRINGSAVNPLNFLK